MQSDQPPHSRQHRPVACRACGEVLGTLSDIGLGFDVLTLPGYRRTGYANDRFAPSEPGNPKDLQLTGGTAHVVCRRCGEITTIPLD